ncbi:MAG TPA: hypothetical protein VIU12_05445 [Chryseolinea sp.]
MQLNDYKKCFILSYDQFITENKILSNQIYKNVRYEKMEDVCRVNLPDNQFFFFKDGKLKMIYISGDALAKKIWGEFNSTTKIKSPEKTVPSRAGKTSNQVIFAQQGITASLANDDVDFIELYPPCALHDYLENIYREQQPFIR